MCQLFFYQQKTQSSYKAKLRIQKLIYRTKYQSKVITLE